MRRLVLLIALLTTAVLPAAAQETTQSPHGDLALPCANCHKSSGWTPVRISRDFDHSRSFPLVGAHASATCRACHSSLDFKGAATTCASCHADVHRGELGPDCSRCHSTRSFLDRNTMLRAHQATRFPLVGAHLAVDCTSCHTPTGQGNLQFVSARSDCVACHEAQFQQARNPDHVGGGFPRDCANCHTATAWYRARFNHDLSAFPLTGAHRATSCVQCHTNGRYSGTSTLCVSCHQRDYDGTVNPKHSAPSFPTTCLDCHSTTDWTGASFNHGTTQFPLTGAHRATPCLDCHDDAVYKGKPTTCVSCHQQDYDQSQNPKHTLPSFASTCADCHTTTAWAPASFNHSQTAFTLTGAHKTTACQACHVNAVYKGTATLCQGCHLPDFNQTTSPAHVTLGWPQTCTTCHSGSGNTTAWDAGVTLPTQYHTMFNPNHHRAASVCTQCHTTTNYSQSTCSSHHHPSSCTFLNQSRCD